MPRHFFTLPALFACLFVWAGARASDVPLPQPPELQQDVSFWVRVYSEISTRQGFVHDQRNLAVVYEKLTFSPELAPNERQAQVDLVRQKYQQILGWLATGASPRDAEDQRVLELWGPQTSSARLAQAANDVRFQLGQADRFRAGLERAARWEGHIARTFAAQGLPPELAVLPHVESSFDPEAYSKAGAAGLWQFMRTTGKRFLRIDTAVDERFDPFRATEAAAQLLSYNYRLLGTWPLAITAYNHGAAGMRRARDSTGSDDIVRIVREYSSPLFGFASRNFYVSFLAAITVDRNRDQYFPDLKPLEEARSQEVMLAAPAPVAAIQGATGATQAELRTLNPALRAPVWSGLRPVPAGYRLRLPLGTQSWTAASLSARLNSTATAALRPVEATETTVAEVSTDPLDYAVAEDGTIRVKAEETLGHYADWLDVPTDSLRRLNAMAAAAPLRLGQRIQLDFDRVGREQFENRRGEYHRGLQAAFFARQRIVGTQVYVIRPGDTLSLLAQRHAGVPVWLMQQYNPDVDLLRLRSGMRIVMPRVEVRPPDV